MESYGATWGSSRHGDEPWKQFHAFDLVRAGRDGDELVAPRADVLVGARIVPDAAAGDDEKRE